MNTLRNTLILIGLLTLFACSSDSDNVVGQNDTNLQFEKLLMTNCISDTVYTKKGEIGTYWENSELFLGQLDDIQSYTLLRFRDFPSDSMIVQSTELKLHILAKSDNFLPMNINIANPKQDWTENYATFEESYTDNSWEAETLEQQLENIHTLEYTQIDSTYLEYQGNEDFNELVQQWVTSDSLQDGICLYPESFEENQLLALYSSENDEEKKPSLIIQYHYPNDEETTLTDTIYAKYDTFIPHNIADEENEDINEDGNQLIIGNMFSQNALLKLDFQAEDLTENLENVQLTSETLSLITINKAELILTVEEYSGLTNLIGIYPRILRSNEEQIPEWNNLDFENLEEYMGIGTSTAVLNYEEEETENKLTLDITRIIQGYISNGSNDINLFENYGLVLTPDSAHKNYNKVKFYDDSAAIESKRPQLKIIYTLPPFLGK